MTDLLGIWDKSFHIVYCRWGTEHCGFDLISSYWLLTVQIILDAALVKDWVEKEAIAISFYLFLYNYVSQAYFRHHSADFSWRD